MKVCIRCHTEKDESLFFPRYEKGRRDKLEAHCKDCHRKQSKKWLEKKPHKIKEYCKRWGRGLRIKALVAVSGSLAPSCKCCSEDIVEFLQIDHINGGGTKESKSYGNHREFFVDIIRGVRPIDGLQVLCANCNHAKGRAGGVCPHEKRLRAVK